MAKTAKAGRGRTSTRIRSPEATRQDIIEVATREFAQNGLSGEPTKWRLGPFSCERFGARGDRNPVLWCLYDDSRTGRGRYYPHQWPEGAAEAVMRFFAALE